MEVKPYRKFFILAKFDQFWLQQTNSVGPGELVITEIDCKLIVMITKINDWNNWLF
jgi:hypothetical protein